MYSIQARRSAPTYLVVPILPNMHSTIIFVVHTIENIKNTNLKCQFKIKKANKCQDTITNIVLQTKLITSINLCRAMNAGEEAHGGGEGT